MADPEHLKILATGVGAWNQWRRDHASTWPDLREANLKTADLRNADLTEADLSGANLTGADLRGASLWRADLTVANLNQANLTGADLTGANLCGADLTEANLSEANLGRAELSTADLTRANLAEAILHWADIGGANLSGANLSGADLFGAILFGADLTGANLCGAVLRGANLAGAKLCGADLTKADLMEAMLVRTDLTKATLTGCRVYGVSAWEVDLLESHQTDMIITRPDEPSITVDDLEVAQFVYLLLNNEKVRNVIDTITAKAVLILGHFSDEQKPVLDGIKEALRQRDHLPILFDFEGPSSRDIGETVSTLAHLARYIIADITDPRCIPQELESIVPDLPSVPVQPLLRGSSTEYGMFGHLQRYPWVLAIHRYEDKDGLLRSLDDMIANLEAKRIDLFGEPPGASPK